VRCARRRHRIERDDERHPALDQIGRQCRQPVGVVACPPKFARDVLAVDHSSLAEALADGGDESSGPLRRAVRKVADDGPPCRLLRARRKRPRCRRAAEQRDELAASFDHLVGAGKQHRRNFQPECFGGLEVYDEIELGWLLNW